MWGLDGFIGGLEEFMEGYRGYRGLWRVLWWFGGVYRGSEGFKDG